MQQAATGSRGGIFLVGIFFMIWVCFVSVEPRMPSDPKGRCVVGGRLSGPFRRSLIGLVGLALFRFFYRSLYDVDDNNSAGFLFLDGILVIAFNVGLSFLCMTTSYVLQCQMTTMINIQPGKLQIPYLIAVAVTTIVGIALSRLIHPNFGSLITLAGAISSPPILQTLWTYAMLTTRGGDQDGRGNVLTQILLATEYYYVFSCLVAFVAEAMYRGPEIVDRTVLDDMIDSMRHHQDIGVDDWTRLLVHSIFVNLIDELTHVTPNASRPTRSETNNSTTASRDDWKEFPDEEEMKQLVVTKNKNRSN